MTTFRTQFFRSFLFFVAVLFPALNVCDLDAYKVHALTGNVNLTEFVTPLTTISTTGFSISTGEFIKYASAPGDVSGTRRMFKNVTNTNWEQFVVDGDFIRRREDTSWAPAPPGAPGAPDVFCQNDNRAVYTLVNDGQPISGDARWLPSSINFVSDKAFYVALDITISPIDRTVLDTRASCTLKGSFSSIYPAPGQRQAMELTYHLANTFTFCSGLKNAEDLIDILVIDGFGAGDHFFYMKGWGFVGFQDPMGRNAGLGSGGTCGSASNPGGGSSPGPGPSDDSVSEPSCITGQYKLTIKATVKSGNTFWQTTDPLTNESRYVDVRSLSSGIQGDMPYVKNVPVNGALIQLHDSQKLDARPGHTESPGMMDGMLRLGYANMYTRPDGTFTLNAESHCGSGGNIWRSDWKGTGYEQYLSISCADKPVGSTQEKIVIKDVWGYLLDLQGTGKDVEVDLGDIQVDCQPVPWQSFPNAVPPSSLESFANRSKQIFLSCSGANIITRSGLESYRHQPWDMDLIFKDDWGKDGVFSWLTWLLDKVGQLVTGDNSCDGKGEKCWGDWVRNHVPFNGRTEVRVAPQTQLYPMEEHAINIDTLLGVRGGTMQNPGVPIPRYFYNKAPADVDTYNDHEEKPILVDCEHFNRCSQTLSDEYYPLDNAQTCGGMWNNLAPPFGGVVRDSVGHIDAHLSGDLIRYQSLPKGREVCKGASEEEVLVRDIMPLPGYCGDINENGVVEGEAVGEMPCPQYFSCDDGARSCSSIMMESSTPGDYSIQSSYKYDIRYFPYSMLYNVDTVNLSEAQSQTSRTSNDSYSSYCPRGYPGSGDGGYQQAQGAGGDSKPSVRGCVEGSSGSLTFYQQTETKFPCTDWTCFKKNENTESTTWVVNPVPATLMGTPQFISSTDSSEIVQKSVLQIAETVTTTDKGHFFRLGIPDDLCTCSLVEDGTNQVVPELRDCVQTDAATGTIPESNDPANIFTPVREQIIGKGDTHLSGDFPGVPWTDSNNPSKVGGGADWEGLQEGTIASPIKTAGDERFKHYAQDTQMPGDFLQTLIEAVNCVLTSSTVENDPGGDRRGGTNCTRTLRYVAENVGLSRGTLPDQPINSLALYNSLDTPFEDQLLVKSGGLIDRTMTKPERLADGNPYGFNSDPANTTSQTTVPGSQGSAYILNYGVAKQPDRNNFMGAALNPIWPLNLTPPPPPLPGPPVGGTTGVPAPPPSRPDSVQKRSPKTSVFD